MICPHCGKEVDDLRGQIKEGLNRLGVSSHHIFKLMYSPKNLNLDINTVVDKMPEDRLPWALSQVKETIRKNDWIRMLQSN